MYKYVFSLVCQTSLIPTYLLVGIKIKALFEKEKFFNFYFQGRNSGLAEGRPTHNAVQTPVGFSYVRSRISDLIRQIPITWDIHPVLNACNGQCWEVVTMSTVLARQGACCTGCSVGQNDDDAWYTVVLIIKEEGHCYYL